MGELHRNSCTRPLEPVFSSEIFIFSFCMGKYWKRNKKTGVLFNVLLQVRLPRGSKQGMYRPRRIMPSA
jgi:hypothetical protein